MANLNNNILSKALNFLPQFIKKVLPKIKLDKKPNKELLIQAPIKSVDPSDEPV